MKNLLPTSLTLNELAAYLDGEKRVYTPEETAFLKQFEAGTIDLEEKEYTLSRTLNLRKPIVFRGNGAKIIGKDLKYGIIVSSGNSRLENFHIKDVERALILDPLGGTMEHVVVECVSVDLVELAFEYGSSASGGVMRDIHFNACKVTGTSVWEDSVTGGSSSLPFSGAAAVARSDSEIRDCLLEDIWFERNEVYGGLRTAFAASATAASFAELLQINVKLVNNTVRRMHYISNYVEECWDGPFNITSGWINTEGALMEDLEFAENKAGFGIAAIYLHSGEPLMGPNVGSVIRNVVIRDNEFTRVIQDVGEPTRVIFMSAARLDYFPHAEARDCVLENVQIYGNIFDGAGPVFCGAYALLDGEGYCENNVLRNVHVYDNRIINVDYAFMVEGAQMEGRRYDWNFGYPRHDKKWLDPVEDDSVVLMRMKNNRVENLLIENNTIEGYRYRVLASGADIRGHGLAEDNKACKNIVIKNNHYGVGERHVRVAHYIGEDFCHDGGGNEVDEALRNR